MCCKKDVALSRSVSSIRTLKHAHRKDQFNKDKNSSHLMFPHPSIPPLSPLHAHIKSAQIALSKVNYEEERKEKFVGFPLIFSP